MKFIFYKSRNNYIDIKRLVPSNLEICNYDVFNEIEISWNKTIEKYGNYLLPFSDFERHKIFFHLIKNACDNKKLSIKNPFKNEIISSDIFFISHLMKDNDNHFVFNYYFEKEGIVLGILSGSGETGLAITFAYIIYLFQRKVYFFHGVNLDITQYVDYFLPKICEIIIRFNTNKEKKEKLKNEKPLLRTFEGYNHGLLHTCCTFVNGLYIMNEIGITNDIDELIMGPNDPFLIEKYYINKYPNINIIKGIQPHEFDIYKFYKGIIFKYSHFHVTNNCAKFIKSYIQNIKPISIEYKNEINYINNNFFPIFSITLRCITCEIKDQNIVISDTINKLKNLYPKAFFFIGGFLGDYNEELLTEQNTEIGIKIKSYSQALNAYQNLFESIKNKLNHNDYKSLINLKINNILEFVKIVDFAINMNAGYICIETILNEVQTIYFGTKWNDHNKRVNYLSKENYKEPIYIEDTNKIKFLSDDIYANITCEISSNTLINLVKNYDIKNNFFEKLKIEKNKIINTNGEF